MFQKVKENEVRLRSLESNLNKTQASEHKKAMNEARLMKKTDDLTKEVNKQKAKKREQREQLAGWVRKNTELSNKLKLADNMVVERRAKMDSLRHEVKSIKSKSNANSHNKNTMSRQKTNKEREVRTHANEIKRLQDELHFVAMALAKEQRARKLETQKLEKHIGLSGTRAKKPPDYGNIKKKSEMDI